MFTGLLSLLNFYCCRSARSASPVYRLLSLLNFYCCRSDQHPLQYIATIKSFEFLLLQIGSTISTTSASTIKSFEFLLLQIRSVLHRKRHGGLLSLLNFYCCRQKRLISAAKMTIKSFEFLLLQILATRSRQSLDY